MHRGGDSGERRIKPPSGGTRPPGLLPLPNAKLPLLLTWTTRPPLPSRGSARFALPPNPPPSHFQPRAPRPAPQASFSLAFPRPPGLIVTRQHGSMDSRATLNLGNASRRPGNPAAPSPSPASPPPVAARRLTIARYGPHLWSAAARRRFWTRRHVASSKSAGGFLAPRPAPRPRPRAAQTSAEPGTGFAPPAKYDNPIN